MQWKGKYLDRVVAGARFVTAEILCRETCPKQEPLREPSPGDITVGRWRGFSQSHRAQARARWLCLDFSIRAIFQVAVRRVLHCFLSFHLYSCYMVFAGSRGEGTGMVVFAGRLRSKVL